MFQTVFNKLHEHSHTGIQTTYKNLFLNITTFHILKNGFQFSYMIVLNVDVINISIKNFKLLQHKRFQNTLRLLIIVFRWTLKDQSILFHTTNLTYMS